MKANRPTVFKPIMLALAVSGLMYSAAMPQAVANDLDIYRPAVEGQTTLVLMLDTSGSMGSDQVGASACDLPAGVGASSTNNTVSSGTIPAYTKRFCRGDNGEQYFDRLSRLKDAIFALMDDASPILKPTTVFIGLAQFSTQSNSSNTKIAADGRSGKIVVKAAPIGEVGSAQRTAIKRAVAAFVAENGTPTANAYAEAGAYLMGASTRVPVTMVRDVYRRRSSNGTFSLCSAYNAINYTTNRQTCNTWTANQSAQPSNAFNSTENRTISGSTFTVYLSDFQTDMLGTGFVNSVADSKSGNAYITPLPATVSECDGQGIYFLTDGEPNSSPAPASLMRAASKNTFSYSGSNTLPSGSQAENGMPEVGSFAKFLFDQSRNPVRAPIKTAVVGYGSTFESLKDKTTPLIDKATDLKRIYYKCNEATSVDARNACNWGEKSHDDLIGVGGYGEGGFYYASSPKSVVESIKSFILELENKIKGVPAGAMVIPQDTLAPDSLRPYAYLPLLQPEPGKDTVAWSGNLKKYNVKEGTLFGGNGSLVFDSTGNFATNTYDLWATAKDAEGKTALDNGEVDKGGAYANLPLPTSTNKLDRNVWIEPVAGAALAQVKPTVSDIQSLGGTNITNLQRRYLLNFLGYDVPETAFRSNPATLIDTANLLPTKLTKSDEALPVMGGVMHSTPQILTYSADLNADGSLSDKREESVLFGSFEGALHIVDADTGVEKMAFIPRSILDTQPRALKPKTTGELSLLTGTIPTPTAFGVDAPWAAYAEYSRTTDKIKADLMYAYGGLRLGGNAFYGLDISQPSTPSLLFSMTPAKSGFQRLGQAWSKPVIARVRYNDKIRVVVIISGGYDADYEKTDKDRSPNTDVKGNAVYMLDAKTGELLLSIGKSSSDVPSVSGSATLVNSNLKYSVVSRIKTLDRDADGLTDHLYFADLGGQLFRVDLQNAPKTAVTKFGTRVVRVADLTAANGSGVPGPRFYETPVVTIQEEDGRNFALINIGSGDRSNPLYLNTAANTDNRIYGILDRDVVRVDLYSATATMISRDIQLADTSTAKGMIDLSQKVTTADKIAVKTALLTEGNGSKNGWYYSINEYNTNKNLRGLKVFNDGVAIANDLYMTVYNPSVINGGKNICSAQVLGGTELHRYCLPFGVCLSAEDGDRQRFPLGQGIQSPVVGADDKSSDTRVLIYPQRTKDIKDLRNPSELQQHRKYPAPPRLVPIRWHEKQPKIKLD